MIFNLRYVMAHKSDEVRMYEYTSQLLGDMEPYNNFVLSSGCDTPPHTPMQNIDAFFKALDDYNGKI